MCGKGCGGCVSENDEPFKRNEGFVVWLLMLCHHQKLFFLVQNLLFVVGVIVSFDTQLYNGSHSIIGTLCCPVSEIYETVIVILF